MLSSTSAAHERNTGTVRQALMALLLILSLAAGIASTASSAGASHTGYTATVNVQGDRSYTIYVCLHSTYHAAVCGYTTNGFIQFTVPTGHSYKIVAAYWYRTGAYMNTWQWPWFPVTYRGQIINYRIY